MNHFRFNRPKICTECKQGFQFFPSLSDEEVDRINRLFGNFRNAEEFLLCPACEQAYIDTLSQEYQGRI